jgi:Na+-translocating ferredoxin:NAD+ oxidoreductase RNF subunit RnfB
MTELTHGFRIDQDQCHGCFSCMRACPTHAIRVRDRKARYQSDHCIDCGACLKACPWSAIAAMTGSVADLSRSAFKVAVPSPVLFGQFPAGITPSIVVEGLLTLGFDAVWDYTAEIGLVSRAVREYVETWKGATPLISITCPVVVRLVQVSYPHMVDQLIPIQPPREIAGREVKRRYAAQLGLREQDVAPIYITPCQAKTISILEPAEGVASNLDGAVGITDVYNAILAYASLHRNAGRKNTEGQAIRNSSYLRWPVSEGLSRLLSPHRYLRVTGLANIIQVFDDIEKGKLRNVDFIEAYNCWSGCTGGNLTVANVYVTLSKFYSLISQLPEVDAETEAEVERRYPTESFSLGQPIRPRPVRGSTGDLRERVQMIQRAGAILGTLPGLNCGLCGAPSCKDLARDISIGEAAQGDCVFLSRERLQQLQKAYLRRTAETRSDPPLPPTDPDPA